MKRYTKIYRKWLFGGFNRNRETVFRRLYGVIVNLSETGVFNT